MKIKDIKIVNVTIPFAVFGHDEPVTMWYSTRYASNKAIIFVETDEGITGIGEAGDYCAAEIEHLKNHVIGKDPFNIETIISDLMSLQMAPRGRARYFRVGPGHPNMVVGAIDMALWDIIGKVVNKPIYKLLGGKYHDVVHVRYWMCCKSPEEQAAEAIKAVEKGWKAFKIKIGTNPETDVERVKAIRESVGNDIELGFDVNGAWNVGTAIRTIKKMERYDPSHIEEPINSNNVIGLAEVRRHVDVPILVCGPGASSKEIVLDIVTHQAADAINVDLLRCGGFLETKRVAGVAEAGGLLCGWHSTCAELGPFEAAKLAFITSTPNMEFPVDDSQHHIEKYGNIIRNEFKTINGTLNVTEGPGLGIEIDLEKLRIANERWLAGKYKHGKPMGFENPYFWKKN